MSQISDITLLTKMICRVADEYGEDVMPSDIPEEELKDLTAGTQLADLKAWGGHDDVKLYQKGK